MSDVPCITYMALYILSLHILQTNSKTSTLWRLNFEDGKIVQASNFPSTVSLSEVEDPIFEIITSTVHVGNSWTKTGPERFCTDCHRLNISETNTDVHGNGTEVSANDTALNTSTRSSELLLNASQTSGHHRGHNEGHSAAASKSATHSSVEDAVPGVTSGALAATRKASLTAPNGTVINSTAITTEDEEFLDCGKPVNFTYYDNLLGISNRQSHPHVPEPQMELIFKKKVSKDYDVSSLERRLKKAKREKPKSVQLYNQIGNFWRIKGDTQKSIECFRRALAVSPHNAEVLLNLARVMFNLQYLDDAIYLTRRSLEVQPPDKNAWQQYFTLGEIFKAYGHYQEATLHLRHALELKPEFEPALELLKDMESIPESTIHIYTLLIILCLVLGVLLVILSNVDAQTETEFQETKGRHFNRAMAMRSIKLGIAPRGFRSKSSNKNGGGSMCST